MASFARGVGLFRNGQYQDAIDCFSQALPGSGDKLQIYDSRAAAYQKLGKLKEALSDAKAVIDLGPDRWQGYARSARLFLQSRKYDAASRMAELALDRIPPDLARRRDEMVEVQNQVISAKASIAKRISRRAYHFGKLPVEIATSMFAMVLEEDPAYVVTLAQVCKNWRATVLDTPAFWTTLVLGRYKPTRKIQLWLERARNRIRELAVLDTITDYQAICEELQSFPTDSLRYLRLEMNRPESLLAALPGPTSAMLSSLDTLMLSPPKLENLPPEVVETPSLSWRVLKLDNVVIPDYYSLACRLSRLENLTISQCINTSPWDAFLRLFLRNPTLKTIEFDRTNPIYEEFIPHPPSPDRPDDQLPPVIPMPALVDVRVEHTEKLANVLLPRLTAPALRSLRIVSHRQRLDSCLNWLLAGPASSLTSLSIQGSAVDAQLLITFLRAAQALETLQLTHLFKIAQPVLRALAAPLDDTAPPQDSTTTSGVVRRVCCPSLRNLDVSHCPDVATGPLIALIKLRLPAAQAADEASEDLQKGSGPAVRRLESLVVDGCPGLDPDALPWLRAAVPSVSCVYLTKEKAKWRR